MPVPSFTKSSRCRLTFSPRGCGAPVPFQHFNAGFQLLDLQVYLFHDGERFAVTHGLIESGSQLIKVNAHSSHVTVRT